MFSFFKKYLKFFIIAFFVFFVIASCVTVKFINKNSNSVAPVSSGRELRQFTYYGTYSVPVDNE